MRLEEYPEHRERWRGWIGVVEATLVGQVLDNYIFRRAMEVAARDGVVTPTNEVYRWLLRSYGTHVAIAVRRLVDSDDSTYSLMALLKKIEQNPQVITREEFVEGYTGEIRSAAHADFDRLAGPNEPCLPRSVVQKDKEALQALSDKIRPLVDKIIAHHEREPGSVPGITWSDLHDAVETLERMCIKYLLVLKREEPANLMPSINRIDADRDIEQMFGSPT